MGHQMDEIIATDAYRLSFSSPGQLWRLHCAAHQMSDQFNQELFLSGKIPFGFFNSMFGYKGCWQKVAPATKNLAVDGWFIMLYNIELANSQITFSEKVKQEVPSSWDPTALAEYVLRNFITYFFIIKLLSLDYSCSQNAFQITYFFWIWGWSFNLVQLYNASTICASISGWSYKVRGRNVISETCFKPPTNLRDHSVFHSKYRDNPSPEQHQSRLRPPSFSAIQPPKQGHSLDYFSSFIFETCGLYLYYQ